MGNNFFGQRIKKLRIDKKISMEELAKKMGVTKSAVSMWENNGNVPREDILRSLSKEFGVSVDYLLGNEVMENKEPDNKTLHYLQRNLSKLDTDKLEKAETLLKTVFNDIFEDNEEEDNGKI